MSELNFSENLIRLRHERKMTQEELADFIGVTKASVSKWENDQSLPDILLLPRLAALFDVSLDSLLGYEPQLSKEQIRKVYLELAAAFGSQPFEQVMERSGYLVKKYYACYSFLLQMSILWLNHVYLAENPQRQQEIFEEIGRLCTHISMNCKDAAICIDATAVHAMVKLQCGKAAEVIEDLEDIGDYTRLAKQSGAVLIQAYIMSGALERADSLAQISVYAHLLLLADNSIQYLAIHQGEPERCDEMIRRINTLVDVFELGKLNPDTAARFYYQAALVFAAQGRTAEALEYLGKYAQTVYYMLYETDMKLYGDSYFPLLTSWFEETDLGGSAPRSVPLIRESVKQSFSHPAFAALAQNHEYIRIQQMFDKEERTDE